MQTKQGRGFPGIGPPHERSIQTTFCQKYGNEYYAKRNDKDAEADIQVIKQVATSTHQQRHDQQRHDTQRQQQQHRQHSIAEPLRH